jgi:hypothetical protein
MIDVDEQHRSVEPAQRDNQPLFMNMRGCSSSPAVCTERLAQRGFRARIKHEDVAGDVHDQTIGVDRLLQIYGEFSG